MKNDLGNLHQSELNKLNILSEKMYTSKVGKENKDQGWSLIAGGQGFSPATKRVAPGYFYWKIEPKEILSSLIPRLLVVFTQQLEILGTPLSSKERGGAPFHASRA